MRNQWIATTLPAYPGKQFSVWVQDGVVMQINVRDTDSKRILGNIYIGKIKNIAANIEAAFVELEGGLLCYVPLSELKTAICTNRTWTGKPRPGDEVLIQVTKEALKTKLPGATGKLSLTGTYLVLTTGKCILGLSGKLSSSVKERLKGALSDLVTEDYGFIVRTNAAYVGEEEIRREAQMLAEQYEGLMQRAKSRSCFSCLYWAEQDCMEDLRGTNLGTLTEIVTDLPEVRNAAEAFLKTYGKDSPAVVRFYEDAILPLYKLYSLEKVLEEALRERVWLKSGGYLVIQPTEALTVIDVNTGKFDGHKKPEETFRKINREAAKEAARQMRLRNLSGILLIDFIDMKDPDHTRELASYLRECLKTDPVKADFVDFTKLGLAEITRKKVLKPLREQLREGTK